MPIRIGRWQAELYRRAIHITREPDPTAPTAREAAAAGSHTAPAPTGTNAPASTNSTPGDCPSGAAPPGP